MFSYSALAMAYRDGNKIGDYRGHSVYSAPCADLPKIGIYDSDYYIIFDAEEKYLYQKGEYIAIVDDDGDLTWLDKPFVPEEVQFLLEEEKIKTRKKARKEKEAQEEKQRAEEMKLPEIEVKTDLVDFEMELDNVLMELDAMMDGTCEWGEV